MKKIKFIPYSEKTIKIIDPPSAAKNNFPEWFKSFHGKINKKEIPFFPNRPTNLTAKACPALLDTFSVGYTIKLDADVFFVDPKEYGHRVIWSVSWDVVGNHFERQIPKNLVPEGFEAVPLKWERPFGWGIKTPPGYSLLYSHPFYRNDLPFFTVPGIVDSDRYSFPINIPFFIKKDFLGLIEKGTPIAQIIPIKREIWTNSVEKKVNLSFEDGLDDLKSIMYRSYKKRWWQKKHIIK
jgi:hypothetical protein